MTTCTHLFLLDWNRMSSTVALSEPDSSSFSTSLEENSYTPQCCIQWHHTSQVWNLQCLTMSSHSPLPTAWLSLVLHPWYLTDRNSTYQAAIKELINTSFTLVLWSGQGLPDINKVRQCDIVLSFKVTLFTHETELSKVFLFGAQYKCCGRNRVQHRSSELPAELSLVT